MCPTDGLLKSFSENTIETISWNQVKCTSFFFFYSSENSPRLVENIHDY